jgi:hypothetical protein
VSEDACQLISRIGDNWYPLGPRWQLPVQIPTDPAQLHHAHALSMTAQQFCQLHPDCGLLEVLTGVRLQRQPRERRNDLFACEREPQQIASPSALSGDSIRSSRALLDAGKKELAKICNQKLASN